MLPRVVARRRPPPIVVGGSGGSGTRAVAAVLRRLGLFIGRELNPELDSIPLGLFDRRWGPRYVAAGSASAAMRLAHEASLLRHLGSLRRDAPWGWKHPQSYLQLPYLAERFPGLRFVHVLRDGRDMALSDNRLQLDTYGPLAFSEPAATPELDLIRLWAWANVRVASDGARLGDQYLQVRLEDLCAAPAEGTERLRDFTGLPGSIEAAAGLIQAPATLGRWRSVPARDLSALEQLAHEGLVSLGYSVTSSVSHD